MNLDNNYQVIEDFRVLFPKNDEEINVDIMIQNTYFPNGINFAISSIYNGSITIKDSKISRISTYVNHFKGNFNIINCEIEELELFGQWYELLVIENCIINGKLIITDSVFHKKVILHKNDFLSGSNLFDKHEGFGSVEFKGGLEFY